MAAPNSERVSARATGVVGVAILCSRVLGLVREMVIASLFGASRNLDAFLTAFRAPNMLRDLFAEGALSTAFVTTFSKRIATEGDQSAWGLANKVATLTAVFMSATVLVGVLTAHWLVAILAPGFDPEKAALTVTLTQVMYPFILLVSLAALAMGMLNAKHVFGMPAMASSFFNLGSIIGGVAIGYWIDPRFGTRALDRPRDRHAYRRLASVPRADSFVSPGRLSVSTGLPMARRGGEESPAAHGPGGDRGERGPGECADQQRLRLLLAGRRR